MGRKTYVETVPKNVRLKTQIVYNNVNTNGRILKNAIYKNGPETRPTKMRNSPTKFNVPGKPKLAQEKLKKKNVR